MTNKSSSRATQLLAQAIRWSGNTQVEIARGAGLPRLTVLSMTKLWQTKLPRM